MKGPQRTAKSTSCKPSIDYPTLWQFKIIGTERNELEKAVKQVVQEQNYSLQYSNVSSGGKYISMNLELMVQSDEHRLQIFNGLAGNTGIKVVL